MKSVAYYECEVCGKRYEDEDEALECERIHKFQLYAKDDIRIANIKKKPLNILGPYLDPGDVYYCMCSSKEAAYVVHDWFREEGYQPPYTEFEESRLFDLWWYDTNTETWTCESLERKKIDNIVEGFHQAFRD